MKMAPESHEQVSEGRLSDAAKISLIHLIRNGKYGWICPGAVRTLKTEGVIRFLSGNRQRFGTELTTEAHELYPEHEGTAGKNGCASGRFR